MIYLDNAATSFPKPEAVVKAVERAMLAPASPGRSGHAAAHAASRTVYRARKGMAKIFGASDPERVCFAPNVTWAINAAVGGFGLGPGAHVLSGSLEHNSTARPLALISGASGIEWEAVPPGPDGVLDPEEFRRRLRADTRLIVLNHASNVTGALAPAREIKEAAGDVPMIVDTAQTAGSVPLDGMASWADVICFTGHKGLLGPTGTGGLCIREGTPFRPLAVGGSGSRSESLEHPDFLPDALEAGTQNTHGLAGLAAAAEFLLAAGVENVRAHEMRLTGIFMEGASKVPGLAFLGPGPGDPRRVATVSVVMEGISSSDLARRLEEGYGIMTRSGLHCAPMAHRASGSFPGGATRFSFGLFNTEEEAVAAAGALGEIAAGRGRR
ncbi:MAG: aminotransferase class V-fold PLP-dependent enzyme [Deltaproteobacteria bacterium]|nr:aminotransferase class V-fold PLP-dependent enzyme [Deltaproteobacteria bacterium]